MDQDFNTVWLGKKGLKTCCEHSCNNTKYQAKFEFENRGSFTSPLCMPGRVGRRHDLDVLKQKRSL